VRGILHATRSFDTFFDVIELLTARVFCRSAFGSDHVLTAALEAPLEPALLFVDEALLEDPPQALRARAAATTPTRARITVRRPPPRALLINDIVSAPFELESFWTRSLWAWALRIAATPRRR
jgi:hypothetical protein